MIEGNFCVPKHKLEERSDEIIITVEAPLSKPKEAALLLEEDIFTFDSPPYLLKVKLPHLVSEKSEKAYDNATSTYKIKFKKRNTVGQEENSLENKDENTSYLEYSPSIDTLPQQKGENRQCYGFANKYSNMFGNLYNEFGEIINLPNPDKTSVSDRRKLRLQEEEEKWSDDHYLADLMETDHLESIFKYKPPWTTCPVTDFNNDEKEILAEIINISKKVQLSDNDKKMSEFQIVDILFGYAYNKRTTEGEDTVESGWTINKLSSTLSWFEVFTDLKSVILACYKRSLVYPLYRSWDLTEMVYKDVIKILRIGPKQVTRSLIEVREIFNDSDNRYILNTLYINDLCNYAYNMTPERCTELSEQLESIRITKREIKSDLPILEVAAHLTLEEETESNVKSVSDKISELNLTQRGESSEESSEESSDDSTDSEDSTQSSDNEN